MTDEGFDEVFTLAVHEGLARRFAQEAERAGRGSRSVIDRWNDLIEKLRREASRAGTRSILRQVTSQFFADAGGSPVLREHRQEIWAFIDGPDSWSRARDLFLLSLVTYQKLETHETADEADNSDRKGD